MQFVSLLGRQQNSQTASRGSEASTNPYSDVEQRALSAVHGSSGAAMSSAGCLLLSGPLDIQCNLDLIVPSYGTEE